MQIQNDFVSATLKHEDDRIFPSHYAPESKAVCIYKANISKHDQSTCYMCYLNVSWS